MEVNGGRGHDKWLPHLLGHEGSGVVVEVGEGVSKFRVGDHVIATWLKSSGIDAVGAIYEYNGNEINSGKVTTFSNYSVISENRLIHKPSNLEFDTAVLFGCALPTGSGMVVNQLKLRRESKVLVVGLGGVGLAALAALIALKIDNIVVIEKSKSKILFAKSLGIQRAYSYDEFNCDECDFDYCFESAGSVSSIEFAFALVKKGGGKLIFASHPPYGERLKIDPHELISGKKIYGTWGGDGINPDSDTLRLNEIFKRSRFDLNSILSKPYKLEEINTALDDLKEGKVMRPLIVMEH